MERMAGRWGFGALVLAASLAGAEGAEAGPRLVCGSPVFEFGRVPAGEVLKHVFSFTNAGGRTLHVTQVKSSCGCTVAGTWSKEVEPGQVGTIPIEVHTLNLTGEVNKPLTVFTDDPEAPQVTLSVRGTVWHPIEVSPRSLVLHFVSDSEESVGGSVYITNHTAVPLQVWGAESNQRGLVPVLKTNVPGVSYELEVRTAPPLGAGNLFGAITLRTSATNQATLNIPIYALTQPAVVISPPTIVLPPGPLASNAVRTVSVRGSGTNEFKVSEVSFGDTNVVSRVDRAPGGLILITLDFPAGYLLTNNARPELRFRTSHPRYGLVSVPVLQARTGGASPAPVAPSVQVPGRSVP